ncbi:nuclease-related domain-containing protein [Paenibacillus soyae]|uniref:NERD domain-containing protein n=1 Tax=Paenibacillus soyae TaxID=2969249 RepID=A0A9X2MTA6_9BACL|nr:nuclease-related domain-containing protein [Paenibacillus soyae]MCR2805859.1 NERD domain-containing protein [Paenibacillus soyae]
MFKKLLSWFKSNSKDSKKTSNKSLSPKAPNKRTVTSSRIGELGEYKINIQLDQLPKDSKYLNDIMIKNPKSRTGYSQIDHIVVSPYGLFVIETKNYNGEIKGGRSDKYWRVNNRFNMFNPLKQNFGHIKALELLLSEMPDLLYISMISFTMRCRFSIDPELRKIESNELVIYDSELSEFINRKLNRIKATTDKAALTEAEVLNIYEIIHSSNITDPALRSEHIAIINKD